MQEKTMKAGPGEDTAAKILSVAGAMLGKEGYESLSMRKIASKLGLSQAAIYRHYSNKAELVAKIVDSGYREMLSRVSSAAEGEGDPREALARSFRAYIAFALERPQIFKSVLLQPLGPAGGEIKALHDGVTRQRESFGLLAQVLVRGMKTGVFAQAEVETTAQAIWAAMFGLTARLVIEAGGEGSLEDVGEIKSRIIEREIELILKGLSA